MEALKFYPRQVVLNHHLSLDHILLISSFERVIYLYHLAPYRKPARLPLAYPRTTFHLTHYQLQCRQRK